MADTPHGRKFPLKHLSRTITDSGCDYTCMCVCTVYAESVSGKRIHATLSQQRITHLQIIPNPIRLASLGSPRAGCPCRRVNLTWFRTSAAHFVPFNDACSMDPVHNSLSLPFLSNSLFSVCVLFFTWFENHSYYRIAANDIHTQHKWHSHRM